MHLKNEFSDAFKIFRINVIDIWSKAITKTDIDNMQIENQ